MRLAVLVTIVLLLGTICGVSFGAIAGAFVFLKPFQIPMSGVGIGLGLLLTVFIAIKFNIA